MIQPSFAQRAPASRLAWRPLVAALVVTVLILAMWDAYARSFNGMAVGARVQGAVVQDASANDDLRRTLNEIPTANGPRVLLFGSSQMHSVKDEPELSEHGMPFQMTSLKRTAPDYQIVDLSGPAQQVFESIAVLLSNERRLAPSVVVLGVGLFNMQSTDIRPTLQSVVDVGALRLALDTLPTGSLDNASRDAIVSSVLPGTPPKNVDSTIQQRIDAHLEHALSQKVAMVGNRRAMYNTLIDRSLRRNLVQFLQRRGGPIRTARTYKPNERYVIALASIDAMAASLALRGVPFVVCIMPFEHSREPVPYTRETEAQVAADLKRASERYHFTVIDLSGALGVDDFGAFVDGSPDNLHFRAHGHAVVGSRIAEVIAPLLEASRTLRR